MIRASNAKLCVCANHWRECKYGRMLMSVCVLIFSKFSTREESNLPMKHGRIIVLIFLTMKATILDKHVSTLKWMKGSYLYKQKLTRNNNLRQNIQVGLCFSHLLKLVDLVKETKTIFTLARKQEFSLNLGVSK